MEVAKGKLFSAKGGVKASRWQEAEGMGRVRVDYI